MVVSQISAHGHSTIAQKFFYYSGCLPSVLGAYYVPSCVQIYGWSQHTIMIAVTTQS